MPRTVPFGAFEGFSDQPVAGTHFYSQGLSPSLYGAATLFSMLNKATSTGIVGMGSIRHIALVNGYMFLQDDSGNILKETTRGQYDFTVVRSPGGNGAGLMADQFGNLFYACGATNNQLGKYDGATWNDAFQSLNSGQHPIDWYEDLVLVADVNNVDCLFTDGSWSSTAFTLPSQMTITAIRQGPTGILIGANMGNRGAIILWDGSTPRSKTSWKWVTGQILSIETYGTSWLVKTDRQVLITNGYTVKEFFGVFDDPLTFNPYSSLDVLPQQMTILNDAILFTITSITGDVSQYGKKKPGLYLYFLNRRAWCYIPVASGATFNIQMNAVYVDLPNNRTVIAYSTGGINYVAALSNQPPASAEWVSEELGMGRVRGQRIYFGPTDKTLEAVILNLGIANSATQATAISFDVSLKVYNFKRQLWGHAVTSSQLSATNQLQIDATIAGTFDAQVGDEVKILEGKNAGYYAHIKSIANDGSSNETWTLDTSFANETETGMNVQVQPFKLVKRQSFTSLEELKNVFFNINSYRGKQFLVKVVFDGITPGLALELQPSYYVFNDIGATQT